MAIEVMLEGTLEEEKDFEGYMKFIQEIAIQNQMKMEIYEDSAFIEVCPEGYIEISCENLFLSICAQTNVAGPGFHAFICSFFHQLQDKSPLALTASDPTSYYEQQNFEHLKYGIFHRWLSDIAAFVKQHEGSDEELCISWPLVDYYQPKHKEGSVVTPLGYIKVKDFYETDVNELADYFFIWNHLERDALYYRNAALNLLWKECRFQYSNMNEDTKKQTDTILDLLEIAYEKDKELPLPVNEYLCLCTLRGRKKGLDDATAMNCPFKIGYRHDIVEYRYGNWSIPANGFCEKSYDYRNEICCLIAPYENEDDPWKWMYRFGAVNESISVVKQAQEWEIYGEVLLWSQQEVSGAAVCMPQEDHILIEALLECNQEYLSVQLIVLDEADKAELIQRLQAISYQKKSNADTQA